MNKSDDSALIFYRPEMGKLREQLFFNEQARMLTSDSAFVSENAAAENLASPYSFWVDLINKKNAQENLDGAEHSTNHVLDIIRSGKRRYIVKGACLFSSGTSRNSPKQYIFVLDRFGNTGMNLPQIFREWRLTKREQDIVRLLFDGLGNKEIAANLNLSVNTVKSYLKFLSVKVGSSGRIGIIHSLLTVRKKK